MDLRQVNLHHAHVFLRGENSQCFRRVFGRDQNFNKLFGYGFGCGCVTHGVERDDAAKRRGRVGLEGFAVGFQAIRADGYAAWIGVFDDDAGRHIK